jgi:phenylalanyl-tRNA synthetase beta chain
MIPGLLRALRFNADRSNSEVSFFEVGATFRPGSGDDDGDGPPVREVQRLSAVFARTDEDALTAMVAWHVLSNALRLARWSVDQELPDAPDPGALHPTRSGTLQVISSAGDGSARTTPIGVVGELHPSVVAAFGLLGTDGQPRRVGWLDLDLDVLLDRGRASRRSEDARPVSRYPSADMDLALVVDDTISAGDVEATLERAIGEQCESVELFDVYRGPAIGDGRRSLAYHLRFVALDHTLADEEMAEIRARCLDAVAVDHGATLRQ